MSDPLYTAPVPASPWFKNGCAAEFKVMRLRELPMTDPLIDTPEVAARFHNEHIRNSPWWDADKESFVVLMLNTRKRIAGFALVAIGCLDTVVIHPREVFRTAIIHAAAAIVMMHNHPSGDPSPSEADIRMTRDLIRAGQLLKLEVVDHVIVGRATPDRPKGYASLRELGYFYT